MSDTEQPGFIIGLVGVKGAGKSSVAHIITEEVEGGAVRMAFADPLKRLALEINPRVDEAGGRTLDEIVRSAGWDVAKAIPSVRRLLQELGSTLRNVDPEHWTAKLVGLLTFTPVHHNIVVEDVRHPNEVQALRSYGKESGQPVFIGLVDTGRGYAEGELEKHESENLARTAQNNRLYWGAVNTGMPGGVALDFVIPNYTKDWSALRDNVIETLESVAETPGGEA